MMPPPGKRIIDINVEPKDSDTRGRTQRSAPTRSFVIRPSTIKHLHVTTRRRVECGADVPGAGHFSRRGLQASRHSASGRAGTVIDGQKQQIVTQYPRRDHRGWSPHKTASRNEQAKPNRAANRIFITSGEIGTHAMHPPGKRKHRHHE